MLLAVVANEIADDLADATVAELNRRVERVRGVEKELAGYTNRIVRRVKELEAQGSGAPPEEVLRRAGASARQAGVEARRCDAADEMPALGVALDAGRAIPENVDTIAAVNAKITQPEHKEALLRLGNDVAKQATRMAPEEFRRYYNRKLRDIQADGGLSQFQRQRDDATLRFRASPDQMCRMYGAFDPEWGEIIENAVRAKARSLASARNVAVSDHLQAEALAMICSLGGTRTPRIPSISVIVDAQTMITGPHPQTVSETWGGQPIPPETVGRLACDALISAIEISEDGLPLRVGHEKRTATAAQRKALRTLYRTCPIDGITGLADCEFHHVNYYRSGQGPTDIENLVPISKRWHHLVHEGGYQLTMDSDRTLHLKKPDGSLYRSIPPPQPITRRQPP